MTTVTFSLTDGLGPLGLSYAADVLEGSADLHRAISVAHTESLQQTADFLRQLAAFLIEKSPPDE